MGYYKNLLDRRSELRRYNAAQRKAAKLRGEDTSRLIRMSTVSDIERYEMAKDADRLTEYNKAVNAWQQSVAAQLRAKVAIKSTRVAESIEPKAYTDKLGVIDRLGFSFARHGIYIHKGAGRGQGGTIGSNWTKLKVVNGVEISTGIVRHTNPGSLNATQGTGNRSSYEWFDPIVRGRLPELADIVASYFDTMIIDATRIYIER
ncbi:MAG: hypothetical protein ACRC3Z_11210 [Phocaeicola sp.]